MEHRDLGHDRHVVQTYLITSLVFGAVVGAFFPLYTRLFMEPAEGTNLIVFSVSCVAAGLLVGLGSFLIGRFTVLRFIGVMAERLDTLAMEGASLDNYLHLYSSDCVGHLASSFNRFVDKLRSLLVRLDAVSDQTRMIGLELAANSTETAASSQQISKHMEFINEQTKLLLQEVDTVDDARKTINASSSLVSENINRQSDSLTTLSSLIEQTVGAVRSVSDDTGDRVMGIKDSITLSQESVHDLTLISRKMQELHEAVSNISSHVGVINDISERIAVLGINASIEASRAGAVGRGFAVVAQEVRSLADSARTNATAITQRLSEIGGAVREGSALAQQTVTHLDTFLTRIAASVEDIQHISGRFLGLSETSQSMLDAHMALVRVSVEVTNSMVELQDGSNSIELSMGTLLSLADENMHAIEEISSGIREISADVVHLDKVSAQNTETVRALNEELSKFRVT